MQIKPKIKFSKLGQSLHEKGIKIIPTKAYDTANAIDLYPAIEEVIELYPDEVQKISLGVHIWINNPEYAGLLMPRSSNTAGLQLVNGIGLIDWDYQGEIFAKVMNTSANLISIKPNTALAQFLIVNCAESILETIEGNETIWEASARTNNGFGSSNGN